MRRLISVIVCMAVLVVPAVGMAAGQGERPAGTALVRLVTADEAGVAAAEASGATLFARLGGHSFLAGADAAQRQSLVGAGVAVTVVDPVLKKGGYTLAYPRPGGALPELESYEEVLLVERDWALLRTSPEAAAGLVEAGAQVVAVTLDPKPWQLHAPVQSFPPVAGPDPLIWSIIDQVTLTDVYSYTGGLSGEWPVEIGGSPYTIGTRYTYSGTPIQQATQYVGEWLEDLGLDVEYHQWGGPTYPNVIGELPGSVNPDDIYIIGGHLDSVPSYGLAPGADDNASGSVATLLAAEILSQFEWGCTLRFAFWTGEEQGLHGSAAYAQRSYNLGEDIQGYLNLDMIAWNTPNSSPDINLYAEPSIPPTLDLAQLFADVVEAYNLDLIPEIIPSGFGASDHASFWNYGYTAILGIEDYPYDFNPYYHTTNDLLQHLDMGYYTDFVKASIGTFAHMTGCLIPGGIGALSGTVTAADDGEPIEGVTVVVVDDGTGHAFAATTDAGGVYTRTLLAGTHTATALVYGYLPVVVPGIVIVTDTVTVQDFALEPEPAPVIRVEPPALAATLDPDGVVTQTLWITNDGTAELSFTLHEMTGTVGLAAGGPIGPDGANNGYGWGRIDAYEAVALALGAGSSDALPWLSAEPAAGTLAPGEGMAIAVRFDATGLEPGIYAGLLDVASNDPVPPHVSVPVTLTVEVPCDPLAEVVFGWEPPTPTAGEVVTLTAEATGSEPITFAWDLGDGTVAAGAAVTHTYALSGMYAVVLTATNPCSQVVVAEEMTVKAEAVEQRIYLPVLLRN